MVRFQVRKRKGRWEVWAFGLNARCWELVDSLFSFDHAMIMATGQAPYRETPGWVRNLTLAWERR